MKTPSRAVVWLLCSLSCACSSKLAPPEAPLIETEQELTPPPAPPAAPPTAKAAVGAHPDGQTPGWDVVLPLSGAPSRSESQKSGREIRVTNSTALGCSTKVLGDFLFVDCGPHPAAGAPLELAVVRGTLSERWVEKDNIGFIAALPLGQVVTVALGWEQDTKVLRVTRGQEPESLGEGALLSAETLSVMAPPEGGTGPHLLAFEHGDALMDFSLWHPGEGGCLSRKMQGELSNTSNSPLGTELDEFEGQMEPVEEMRSPSSPVILRFSLDRAFTRISEHYEEGTLPEDLERRCVPHQFPALRSRLWPLRSGDTPGLQPMGDSPEPTEEEFENAHPRSLVARGAEAQGCRVRRVRNFVQIHCSPDEEFGRAKGSWVYSGKVLASKSEGSSYNLVLQLNEHRKASGELIWEHASLAVELFGSRVPSQSGGIEPSTYQFYRTTDQRGELVMRVKTTLQSKSPATGDSKAGNAELRSPEIGTAAFQLIMGTPCVRHLDGYASYGWEQASDYAPVKGASWSAQRYFSLKATLAIDSVRGLLWITDPKTNDPAEAGSAAPCRLRGFRALREVPVGSVVQPPPAP